MVESPYSIRLPHFEGPLDLLLHLIRENKVDIYDIPIAEITRQYLEYLELMKELNLEIAGEFLVMAATLIQIKTRMLLPVDEDVPPEEREDPRIELVERLLEYQAIKGAAIALNEYHESWLEHFWRQPSLEEYEHEETQMGLFDVNIFDLLQAFKKVLEKAPPEAVTLTRETLTIKDKINYIIDILEKEGTIRFESLFGEGVTRIELIVTFLALLEILRLGIARVYQEKEFGQIWIIRKEFNEQNDNSQIQR
ncbi:MAG: segregation/condensation protein A [Nitrospirae bacterium]|nr:segregation/condensation protein A [Nitrospirota bacterium]